jgi:hypothetical protein
MTKLRAKRIQIEPRSGGILLAPGFRGCCSTPLEQNVIPFFAKEGWPRPKEKCCEASFERSGRGSCFKLPLMHPERF